MLEEQLLLAKNYLDKISHIVQTEGTRDNFILQKRLKELNKLYPDSDNEVIIYDSWNTKGICNVYYGFPSNPSSINLYTFKLGRINKKQTIKYILHLKEWEDLFNQEVRDTDYSLYNIKDNIIEWVSKYKISNNDIVSQFLNTLKIYEKYTGQIIVSYKEFNNELIKIKPIIRLYEEVTLDELYEFAKNKSKLLWNREFTCRIEMINTYWKQQLGLYSTDNITIYFSNYKNSEQSKAQIFDTMLHEMVHWHLHTSGQNYSDEDFEFIEECQRVGCALSGDSKAQKAFYNYIQSQKAISI